MNNVPFDNRSFFVNRRENIDEDVENIFESTARKIPSKIKQEMSTKLYEIQCKRIQKLTEYYEHQIGYLTESYDLIIDAMEKTIEDYKELAKDQETKINIQAAMINLYSNSKMSTKSGKLNDIPELR